MPRDISGNYTLPAGNPVVTGTTISSTWANDTLSDIATALTQSLSINGSVTPLKLAGFSSGNTGVVTVTNDTTTVTTKTPSVNGIQFPATQVPNSDPNCLDDYEEGSWTPTLTFDTPGNLTVSYSTGTVGSYTKIGRMVSCQFIIGTTSFNHTTASGNLRIGGLPFTPNSSSFEGSVNLQNPTWPTNRTQAQLNLASSVMNILSCGSGQGFASFGTANMVSGGTYTIVGFITYFV